MRKFLLDRIRFCLVLTVFVIAPFTTEAAEATADAARNAIALEALSRLKGIDLETNPAIKSAVMRVLETTKGTPQFVELVRDFKIKDQNPALFALALHNVTNATGVDATRLILENNGASFFQQSLSSTNQSEVLGAVELLGNVAEKQVVSLLEPVVLDSKRDPAVRKRAVHAMAGIQDGASTLLSLAKADKLPADLRLSAAAELNKARWPEIKTEAAFVLPLPQTINSEPLPPVAELATRKGDRSRGAEVFARPTVGCINCHQVNGKGVDFGPNLSEIGTKLGKDALYESILNPSSGISFGYEAWSITLKSGDEAFGLLASETADELAIKAQTGIVTRYKKTDVEKREQKKLSIMPEGLQQTMSVQDLVDLIEYLSSLKKSSG